MPSGAGDGARTRPTGAARIGVLAVQGDVREHLAVLGGLGVTGLPVTRPEELSDLAGLVLPGGESTTIGKMLVRYDLMAPLTALVRDGLPVLGTCAGAILLGTDTMLADGRPSDQHLVGVLDVTTRRNAFGRQVASFEGPVLVRGVDGGPMHGVFIRAPWFERVGPAVEALASVATPLGDKVVVVQQGSVLACAFHPELSGDDRLHRRFLRLVAQAGAGAHGDEAPAGSS